MQNDLDGSYYIFAKVGKKYNFLERISQPLSNRTIELDTASMFLALIGSTINECMTAESKKNYSNWIRANCTETYYLPDDVFNFLPRICCNQLKKFDN